VRVLLANKFFRRGAGAETVFFDTLDLLEDAGHTVIPFAMADEANEPSAWSPYFARRRDYVGGSAISRARDGMSSIYSPGARRKIGELIRAGHPDVAHLHNVYHQLTLSIVDELRAAGVPTVMTVHDYKPVCPNYQLLTHDGACTRCVTGSYVNAVVHRCVKGSRAASSIAALEASLNRLRRQYDKIDRFIAPSAFLRDVLVDGGIPASRIDIVPNPVAVDDPAPRKRGVSRRFVYIGRLAPEKGILTLLDAVGRTREPGITVHLYGTGPMEAEIRERAVRENLPVELHGLSTRVQLARALADARALVLPSVWFENCPMSVIEAGAAGVPAIASSIGGIPELVVHADTGLLVPPRDADALAHAIDTLAADVARSEALGNAARSRVIDRHCPDRYRDAILDVYCRAGSVRPTAATSTA
jgi:glycosyltransferase involved in cell wall biosynthesis